MTDAWRKRVQRNRDPDRYIKDDMMLKYIALIGGIFFGAFMFGFALGSLLDWLKVLP